MSEPEMGSKALILFLVLMCCSTAQTTQCPSPTLLDVVVCKQPNFCQTSAIAVSAGHKLTVTAMYKGLGPFKVDWYLNGSAFKCDRPACVPKNSSEESSITLGIELLPPGFIGEFEANVSNLCGWNISSTLAKVMCTPPYPPIPISHNDTKTLTVGKNATLTCEIAMSTFSYLGICYAPPNKTFTDINQTENCIICFPFMEGYCGSPPIRPKWKISRGFDNHHYSCAQDYQKTTLNIGRVSRKDEGKMYCYWKDDVLPPQVYTFYDIKVRK